MTNRTGISLRNSQHNRRSPGLPGVAAATLLFLWLPPLFAQVAPAEIRNPQLKASQQTYLPRLLALNRTISEAKLPFPFSLNRHVGLDPKDQIGADTRGLEFVIFHEREVLKFTGNYNAAFNADSLTPNQRAARVLNDVVLPVLRLLPEQFNDEAAFDAFGFEIGYHVRRHTSSYEFEGKETLVVVLDKSDGLRYGALSNDAQRQELLNRSEIYLSGEPLGLALNSDTPFDIDALRYRPASRSSVTAKGIAPSPSKSKVSASTTEIAATSPSAATPSGSHSGSGDLHALQVKYQPELESLQKVGIAKYHFAEYAPVSFVAFRNQSALQVTLHNPQVFDKETGSLYTRAARTFDMFLAPQMKGILEKVPENPDFSVMDFTVLLDVTSAVLPRSSEAIEFIFQLKQARQFTAAEITNQDLINVGVVLVNGVRIELNLAQVE